MGHFQRADSTVFSLVCSKIQNVNLEFMRESLPQSRHIQIGAWSRVDQGVYR
jgi:hypothetical protein